MVLHIPHDGFRTIPFKYTKSNLDSMVMLRDSQTRDLFHFPAAWTVYCEYDRHNVDVERFIDDSMEQSHGMGVLYTKDVFGNDLPTRSYDDIQMLMDYYHNHHKQLQTYVNDDLSVTERCVIVDCHSFGKQQVELMFPDIDTSNLPDVCIGFNEGSCSDDLLHIVTESFLDNGYTVAVNYPYSGSILPMKMKDGVESIMIEVNKAAYEDNKFNKMKDAIQDCLNCIYSYENA